MTAVRRGGIVALALVLSACSGGVVPRPAGPSTIVAAPVIKPVAATPITPAPAAAAPATATAAKAGLLAGPPLPSLPINEAQAARALAAFRTSCNTLQRRTDASGLTRGDDWQPACSAAAGVGSGGARGFFAQWFETVQVGDGKAFATGYYEPEIAGSRNRRPGYDVPIYGRPTDLVDVDLSQFSADLKGKKIRGRVDGSNFVPYFDRTAIEQGALAQRAPIIAWAADPVELFFLQIQGSGRLKLPDGSVMRIGYESQNGRDYTGIGALMKQRGLLGPGQTSMQGIVAWLRSHPEEGAAIMRENKSYVFFREQQTPPLGALGLPVTAGVSVAADPRFVPLGAPAFLSMDRADATGLWVAQDTGGAIRGSNRFDTFWGAGDDAEARAGGMSARGTAFLLLPVGTLARLAAERASGGAPVNP
ncbi:MAG: murein transglycosylase A [Sphingomonas sp.]|uniref:murein transglycosylase A n=1 Tax=Sphingomonas sp. TaxID=28214 RepID=UPI00356307E8